MTSRKVEVSRKTRETDVSLALDFDSSGVGAAGAPAESLPRTGIAFFDHLLAAMAFHGGFHLSLKAQGDLEVDPHHLVEDTGLAFGQALAEILGKTGSLARFGHATIPMDEALAEVAIDVCGRSTLVWKAEFPQPRAGSFELSLLKEFFAAVAFRAGISLHACIRYAENGHHAAEALFKAFGKALHKAYSLSDREMSTKGRIG